MNHLRLVVKYIQLHQKGHWPSIFFVSKNATCNQLQVEWNNLLLGTQDLCILYSLHLIALHRVTFFFSMTLMRTAIQFFQNY